jgi:3-phenylpropionate/cinnamic acid dioxygenase small subunit
MLPTTPIERLSDRQAAQDVIVAYANSLDDRDFDSYRRLFHPDLTLEGFGPEPIRGVDAWLAFVEKALEPYRQTQHMLGPPQVQIDGDTASVRTDLQALHFLREPKGQIFWLWGAYRSQLVRDGAGWLIQKHRLDIWGTRRE